MFKYETKFIECKKKKQLMLDHLPFNLKYITEIKRSKIFWNKKK